MLETVALKTPGFWLRVIELVFGIIAFAPVAEGAGYSRFDFAIFCGVTTMLFSLLLITTLLLGVNQVKGLPSLVYDGLYFIFWLSCAAALSDMIGWIWDGAALSRLQAATAFSWLTWFAFIASIVCDAMDLRHIYAATNSVVASSKPKAGDGKAAPGAAPTPISAPVVAAAV